MPRTVTTKATSKPKPAAAMSSNTNLDSPGTTIRPDSTIPLAIVFAVLCAVFAALVYYRYFM